MSSVQRVVIVGGGFGGLAAARALRRAAVSVQLVDRRNYHLFQPLLYQVATGELSPANIASPLRGILRHQKNCQVLMGEVADFDLSGRRVLLNDGELRYDALIVAAGASHSYFGHEEWSRFAPALKTIEDATEIRGRLLYAFEAAERETDPRQIAEWLTFMIVGAGPTGVELAGALSEIAHYTLKHDFRQIHSNEARILLVEAGPHPLAMYSPKLVQKARDSLAKLNVQICSNTRVVDIQPGWVKVLAGGVEEVIPCRTVIWAAGVQASPLGRKLADASGAPLDRAGRVVVAPDLSLPNHPDVFVIGDLASYTHQGEQPLPGLAPVAMQQGQYVARLLEDRRHHRPTPPFRYRDRGSMAVIGRYAAIAEIHGHEWSGLWAWIVWIFIHLMEITQFRNRLLVFTQWGWTFFTRDRAARLITYLRPHRNHP